MMALIVCAVITTILTGDNPLAVYGTGFKGGFGTPRKSWITLQNISILLIISLALTPAFKMQFWNIGGEGQVLMGGLAAAACMLKLGGIMPQYLVILFMVVSSIVAGAIWESFPQFLKQN